MSILFSKIFSRAVEHLIVDIKLNPRLRLATTFEVDMNRKKPRPPVKPSHPYRCEQLVAWCNARGEAAKLADQMGVSQAMMSGWVSGKVRVPAERCPEFARLTNGAVQPKHLRPDINWSLI